MSAAAEVARTATGRRIEIRGTVQGVGFRPWVYRLACRRGLGGRVRNDAAGVTIEAFGPEPALDAFCRDLETSPPAAAAIRSLSWFALVAETGGPEAEAGGFVIEASRGAEVRSLSIPPDLASCEACLQEVADPGDRRHGYPFTNCTDCGPRFTIARGVPYDRPETTMAGFELCADCRREYLDPGDRRFHAQPNACPVCGPRLRLLAADGGPLAVADPLAAAAGALGRGLVVAVKGIGGFHLACDATSSSAVQRLRLGKGRREKPFAVMVRDLPAARRLATLSPREEELLAAVERPIVLCRRRAAGDLAEEVAPGLGLVGLLLPYSPLHHLLLEVVGRPLVMTSGNLSEEPMVRTTAQALERLANLADFFLVHDRPIAARCDDSVARVVAGSPLLLRRSRGYVPRPIAVARPFPRPVLACGAQLKNTFCLGVGDAAYLGPHLGDLEVVETFDAFAEAVEHLERLLGVEAEVIAHDLHPEYPSTAYAHRRRGIKVAVQHHHAHVASALAEHGLDGPVLGVAFDGTGLGTDGSAWGGEILRADAASFERLATLRPLALAGGDTAIRQVWRLALALLDDAFDGRPPLDRLPLFRGLPAARLGVIRRIIAAGTAAPLAHGAGRYFDAVGALLLDRPQAAYEGQVALALELAADGSVTGTYPWTQLRRTAQQRAAGLPALEIDLRPAVRALVEDRLRGSGPALPAARFHNTLAAATAQAVRALADDLGSLPVVLTGGCFQNDLLTRRLSQALEGDLEVHLHRRVPAGDGGIALGQVLVAGATAIPRRRIPCA